MPLPDNALTVDGGCNCGALRYRIAIPPLADRPLHPLTANAAGDQHQQPPVRLPFLVFDHCNDCRRATASILPAWLCAPIAMASVSLVYASTANHTNGQQQTKSDQEEEERRSPWTPASIIFNPNPDSSSKPDHLLAHYQSSHQRWRWFCSRCGTNIAYTAVMPEGFPDMLDVTLGSLDREHLDSDALVPERHLWWDYGVDWIRRLATRGYGDLPVHRDYRVAESVNLRLDAE